MEENKKYRVVSLYPSKRARTHAVNDEYAKIILRELKNTWPEVEHYIEEINKND